MLKDNERALPRRIRRALLADRRTLISKRRPFGRVKITDFQTPPGWLYEADPKLAAQSERTEYKHFTKGRMSRRTTVPLLDNLISIG